MDSLDCDFTPLKEALKKDIHCVMIALEQSLEKIEHEQDDLFDHFQKIKDTFLEIEMKAANFYLTCYLAPFTNKYLALSACIQNMSKQKHGGLIVIEREDSVTDLIQQGVPIEAELTQALLGSIFYPGNPLHDGAVVIRHNQIASAANVLPLSKRKTEDTNIGTRHRAAMGLTEQCDALVLVISEESGRVSFTYEGNLYPIMIQDPK